MAAKTAVLNRFLTVPAGRPWRCPGGLFHMLLGVGIGLQLGCGSDSTGPSRLPISQAFWALQLNAHAVNMALTPPVNVVQLHATALTATGASLPGGGQVVYSTADSLVSVDSTGLVTAHFMTSGNPTQVIATLTVQGVTLADTAQVQVDVTPRSLKSFSIHPVAGDSAKCAVDAPNCVLPVLAVDTRGDTLHSADIDSILISVTSSDPNKVGVDQLGHISQQSVITSGVVITANTLAYGVAWRDSVRYTIGYPIFEATINLQPVYQVGSRTPEYVFSPVTNTYGVGALVTWGNEFTTPVDVVFDDSAAVQGVSNADSTRFCQLFSSCIPVGVGGNIAPFQAVIINDTTHFGNRYRIFPVAGTYPYHSRLLGIHGTIVISAGP